MKHQLEIACFDLDSALIAAAAGADRIELCDKLSEGGTTPSWEMVFEVKEKTNTEFYLMIRPRGGDFCYTEEEFEQMKNEIILFKRLGVHGFVFGILNENGTIDMERNKDLLHFAYPFPCTFHRAFDRTPDVYKSLEQLIELGFSTILTSGGAANVNEGLAGLKKLVEQAAGRIVIMPGGGLRSANIQEIRKESEAGFYHSSAIVDESLLANKEEIESLLRALK